MDKKGLKLKSVIFNETQQESWPERDQLPTQDPIGDVDEIVEFPDSHAKDVMKYISTMRGMIIPEGQTLDSEQYKDLYKAVSFEEPRCNCGTFAVHGKVPADAHRPYCALRKDKV